MAGGVQSGEVYTPPYASEKLYNHDLAPAERPLLGLVSGLLHVDVGRPQRRRLSLRGEPFRLGLAGWQVLSA